MLALNDFAQLNASLTNTPLQNYQFLQIAHFCYVFLCIFAKIYLLLLKQPTYGLPYVGYQQGLFGLIRGCISLCLRYCAVQESDYLAAGADVIRAEGIGIILA